MDQLRNMDPVVLMAGIVVVLIGMAAVTALLDALWKRVIGPFLGRMAIIALFALLAYAAFTAVSGDPAADPARANPPASSPRSTFSASVSTLTGGNR